MPAGYSSNPISGFTGHIPGAKWQVGGRYEPPTSQVNTFLNNAAGQVVDDGVRNMVDRSQLGDQVPGVPPAGFDGVNEMADEMRSMMGQPGQNGMGGNMGQLYQQMPQYQQPYPDTRSHISFNDGYVGPAVHTQPAGNMMTGTSQASILRPGSSQMSMGYNAQGMPVRLNQNERQAQQQQQQHLQYQQPPHQHYQQHQQQYQQQHQRPPQQQQYYNGPGNGQYQNGYNGGAQYEQYVEPTQIETRGRSQAPPAETSNRSRSVPKKRIEKDPFEGIEGGWWSKGEVMRNKERREMADKGKSITGGNWNQKADSPRRERKEWRERPGEEHDIPAAGYSGHIQGLRNLGVGKSFNTAAKEAKKEYVERRRARSGGREQFYSSNGGSQLSSQTEQLNYNHSVASGMPRAPY